MLIARKRFNIYLLASLAAVCLCGCNLFSIVVEKKVLSSLALHMETNPDMPELSSPVPIYRQKPIMVNVEKSPFLTEADISEAKVMDVLGGFALRIQFTAHGRTSLEQYTASNPGKRIAILCRFGPKFKEVRWLAAPHITRRISDGVLTFTPDATREEAEQIVLGLNNMAQEASKPSNKW